MKLENLNKEIYSDTVYNELQKRIKAFNDSFQKISKSFIQRKILFSMWQNFWQQTKTNVRFDLSILNKVQGKKQEKLFSFDWLI
nr:hypothetical protein [Mycoplasmopsis bovis]